MNNLNSVLLEGIVSDGPAFNNSPELGASCDFVLVSNRYYKKGDDLEEEQSFFDVRVKGHLAEICNEYLSKGHGVRIVGRLKQDRWEAPADDYQKGGPRSKVYIVAEHVEFKPRLPSA